MFDARYGDAIRTARAELETALAVQATRIAEFEPRALIREPGLLHVLEQLAECQTGLRNALGKWPLAVAVDTDGRRDRLGPALAELMATLEWVLVFYRNLDRVPEPMRGDAHRRWEGLVRDANGVLALLGR
jgi:hypothetical protein